MKKIKCFTLAEILITLSILGVVAAISIPNMVQQYQKRATITKLQKAYANLETAAMNIRINSGCFNQDMACTGLLTIKDNFLSSSNPTKLAEKFKEFSGINGDLGTFANMLSIPTLYTSGTVNLSNSITTKDGIAYSLRNSAWGEGNGLGIYVITDTSQKIQYNPKPKNLKLGKNVFLFIMYDNFIVEPAIIGYGSSLIPMSKSDSTYNAKANCDTNKSGISCAARIIQDGWKINY